MRVQTLGGPGSFTRIVTRGLRPQDTAITIDGLRFRDAATTQGDATPFLQDLVLLGTERIEVLRGTGSSVYGSNATGGVVNLVSDTGGGPLHGEIKAEGGGLGMMRGLARLGGGTKTGRFELQRRLAIHRCLATAWTATTASAITACRARRSTGRFAAASLTARLWAADSFAQVQQHAVRGAGGQPARRATSSHAVPVSLDVQHRIEAGRPISYAAAPISCPIWTTRTAAARRASCRARWSGASSSTSASRYRVPYHKVVTKRALRRRSGGRSFPAASSVADRIRGGTDTVEARTDIQVARWNTFTGGIRVRARELSQPAPGIPARARQHGVLHRRRPAGPQRLLHRPVPPPRRPSADRRLRPLADSSPSRRRNSPAASRDISA